MAEPKTFPDLDRGDETRRNGDYIGLPHDESTGGVSAPNEGDPVSVDANGNIKQAEGGDTVVGVLYTYPYAGENNTIRQNRDATVKTKGAVKAHVYSSVTAGDALEAPATGGTVETTAGQFGVEAADQSSNFVALTDAVQDDDGEYYAEVLLR